MLAQENNVHILTHVMAINRILWIQIQIHPQNCQFGVDQMQRFIATLFHHSVVGAIAVSKCSTPPILKEMSKCIMVVLVLKMLMLCRCGINITLTCFLFTTYWPPHHKKHHQRNDAYNNWINDLKNRFINVEIEHQQSLTCLHLPLLDISYIYIHIVTSGWVFFTRRRCEHIKIQR